MSSTGEVKALAASITAATSPFRSYLSDLYRDLFTANRRGRS
jgi:hypothetical protein